METHGVLVGKKWPSSEVPPLNGTTGTWYSLQRARILDTSSVERGKRTMESLWLGAGCLVLKSESAWLCSSPGLVVKFSGLLSSTAFSLLKASRLPVWDLCCRQVDC